MEHRAGYRGRTRMLRGRGDSAHARRPVHSAPTAMTTTPDSLMKTLRVMPRISPAFPR
jgi:hypothetical protein